MKKEYIPFYGSRFILSCVFSILVMGLDWKALILALMFFGLFLLYLHSGWFSIDLSRPLVPLRRDLRGREIQRKALIASVVLGLLLYLFSPRLSGLIGLPISGGMVLFAGIITYFVAQFILFARA